MTIGLVISTHTHPELLQRALKSINGITFDSITLIDDNALDTSFIKTIPCLYPNIKLIVNNETRGLAEVRNQGIIESDCDWITFLDDDDYYITNPIDSLRVFITKNPSADIIHFPIKNKELNGNIINWGPKQFTLNELLISNKLAGCSLLKKEVWKNLGGFKNIPYEDWEFWIRAKKARYTFRYFPCTFYFRDSQLNGLENITKEKISVNAWIKKYIQ